MKSIKYSCLIASLLFTSTVSAQWEVGVSKADISPLESVPLAGYGGKTRMSQEVIHPIWLKAMAFRDLGGKTAVLVTADLVGLSEKMVSIIAENAEKKYGISRDHLILNTSHNHSCPVTEDVLWLYYELNAEEASAKDRYTKMVYQRYDEVIASAVKNMIPAELQFEQGLAGFGVNRRRSRGSDTRSFGGQVDQDVPVLSVRSGNELKAVLFGYSCHTTALGGLSISGDYAGFAQVELEKKYPGALAMFVQNCGGDANPLPRIRGNEDEAAKLAEMYGKILAESVNQVLANPMQPISGPVGVVMDQTQLMLSKGLSLEELKKGLNQRQGMERREYEHQIHQYETTGTTPDRVDYPIQVWRFGKDFMFIALTGETVVDYSLKFKEKYGWNTTWVFGYNNNLLSYVPSLRVLKEGGYEGTDGMLEYGHRAPYTDTVEQLISDKVDELVKQVIR